MRESEGSLTETEGARRAQNYNNFLRGVRRMVLSPRAPFKCLAVLRALRAPLVSVRECTSRGADQGPEIPARAQLDEYTKYAPSSRARV